MNDRIKGILGHIKEFWNKYNKKQKTVMISLVVLAVLVIALVVWLVSRPKWEELKVCSNYAEVTEVETLLTENSINYNIGDDALTVSVAKADLVKAKILLGSNDIKTSGYSIDDALNGGFSTTEKDKTRKYNAYLESKLATELKELDQVKSAKVTIKQQESSSVILASSEDTSVAVILSLKSELEDGVGEGIAMWIKTAVGNKSTEKITILSVNGQTIFSGENSSNTTVGGSLVNQQKYKATIENTIKNSIKSSLLKLPMYDDAQISLNLDIDYNEVQEITKKYEAQEGREEGLFTKSYEEVSTGTTGSGGVPGTESNDSDTTYYIQNSDGSTTEYTVKEYYYQPDEFITTTNKTPGQIIKANSSISVVLQDNLIYNYEDVKAAGLLKGTTWDDFKKEHGDYEQLEVDDQIKEMIAKGTGIDVANVSVLAYKVPYFFDAVETPSNTSRWITIAVAVVILLLLAFVLFRSARPITVTETEPELSVEEMLASTKEKEKNGIDDIDVQEKSDVRIAIEKFVDENPEAVALLLRNWLDDGWD